jgi:uncharacterized RDD family membrane protein YckC
MQILNFLKCNVKLPIMNTNYAGFWYRFIAWIIDRILLSVVGWIIIGPILAAIGVASHFSITDFQDVEDLGSLVAILGAMFGVALVVHALIHLFYHALFEASKYQGSVGKMALGIIVTDVAGQKLDFGKAFVRNLCKYISGLTLYVGYIIAGFTDKKQALHDLIAGTLVVRKPQAEVAAKPN